MPPGSATARSLSAFLTALALLLSASGCRAETIDRHGSPSAPIKKGTLPLPSALSVFDYETRLFDFLNRREYAALGWARDKRVRDTGPYRNGKYYGTHPAVRIYYSPEIIGWLKDGLRHAIPDGAMIIKEQFHPPAARYAGMREEQLLAELADWTVMVKDSAGSHDGWFWSNPVRGQKPIDNRRYPFDHAASGFGMYCLRCHASAKTPGETNEYTFAALRNIEGFPGEPIEFDVDDSWRVGETSKEKSAERSTNGEPSRKGVEQLEAVGSVVLKLKANNDQAHPRCTGAIHPDQCQPVINEPFLALFNSIPRRARSEVQLLPGMTHDWIPRRPALAQSSQQFVTSTQCMNCHAGLDSPLGRTMFFSAAARDKAKTQAVGVHLSPYGEWRWTPMGLAGRDPVFFAQLESEMELLKREYPNEPKRAEQLGAELADACLTCHGAMGKHQFAVDHPGELFGLSHVMRDSTNNSGADQAANANGQYGALARDGISCTVCHRMQPRDQPADDERPYLEFFLETSITGHINLGPSNELYGPFEDKEIAPYAMEHAIAFKPKQSTYIKSSQLCGSCHVVNLPCIDMPLANGHDHKNHDNQQLIAAERKAAFRPFHHHVEQATYLEWLNSEFENELTLDNPKAKTCQDCHMKRSYRNDRLGLALENIETQIAAVQDYTYPEAESLATKEELNVKRRASGYARHNFRGLNVFLVEMFNQFDDLLGVRKFDFMTGSQEDIPHAVDDFLQQAKDEVANLDLSTRLENGNELIATVNIQNKVGHRFPSGVGFRRAFIELLVTDDQTGRMLWSSGRTNDLGVLIDQNGQPLPSEFFAIDEKTKQQTFQPHHQMITSPAQVQVYETLLRDAKGRFTTSFIRGSEVAKDNRLLPRGWKADGPSPALNGEFLRATHPDAATKKDPRYTDGSGSDEVTYRIQLPVGVNPHRLTVKATLYYQAIPPYFLKNIFDAAPNSPAAHRLHYLCSNIDLRGKPIAGWKLPIVSSTASVR